MKHCESFRSKETPTEGSYCPSKSQDKHGVCAQVRQSLPGSVCRADRSLFVRSFAVPSCDSGVMIDNLLLLSHVHFTAEVSTISKDDFPSERIYLWLALPSLALWTLWYSLIYTPESCRGYRKYTSSRICERLRSGLELSHFHVT